MGLPFDAPAGIVPKGKVSVSDCKCFQQKQLLSPSAMRGVAVASVKCDADVLGSVQHATRAGCRRRYHFRMLCLLLLLLAVVCAFCLSTACCQFSHAHTVQEQLGEVTLGSTVPDPLAPSARPDWAPLHQKAGYGPCSATDRAAAGDRGRQWWSSAGHSRGGARGVRPPSKAAPKGKATPPAAASGKKGAAVGPKPAAPASTAPVTGSTAPPRKPPIIVGVIEESVTLASGGTAVVRRFQCRHPGCGATFTLKSNCVRHGRGHTGERPYPCPFPGCTKAFTQRQSLR